MPPTRLRLTGASSRSSQITDVCGVAVGAGAAEGAAGAGDAVAGAGEAVAGEAVPAARTTSPGGRAPDGIELGVTPGAPDGDGDGEGNGAGGAAAQGCGVGDCTEVALLPRMTSAIEVTWATPLP
jgi:hypothetical protein